MPNRQPTESNESGANVGGNVDTGGGGFTGRDRKTQQDNQQTVNVNLDTILLHLVDLKIEISEIKGGMEGVKRDVSEAHEKQATLINNVADIKRNQYPRFLQGLIIVLAITMIILLTIFLVKVW